MNVRDYGAKGDGQTDDTAAFLSALAALDGKKVTLPGLTLTGGGALDVPGGVYRLSAELPLHQRTRLRLEPDAYLLFDAGGLAIDSGYTQAQSGVEVTGGHVYSTHGGIGLHARGGGYSLLAGTTWCGWDEALVLDASNGVTIRDAVVSSWPGLGAQSGVGVRFALRPSGGGQTNGNVVERCQFNGRSIAVACDDGQGNVVRDCNVNAPGEVARVTGAVSLTIERCQAEGVTGDCYVRLGLPGGYSVARIVAQQLSVVGCAFSRNEAHAPSILRMEKNAQAWDVALDRTAVLASRTAPLISCAEPWPAMSYVMIRGLSRRGVLVAGASLGALRPVVTDRDLYGLDGGP